MKAALQKVLTVEEFTLLKECNGFEKVFSNPNPENGHQSLEVMLRLIALDLNDKMKEALSETPQNKEMYPHYVADFDYLKNALFQLLKSCVTSQRRSAAQKRKRNTDPLPKGTASSGKGAAGGAANADPPMQEDTTAAAAASGIALGSQPPHNNEEAASGSKRTKRARFTLENVDPDVIPLIKGIDRWKYEDMTRFKEFLNENFGKPYDCTKLKNKAERVFLMEKLLQRMLTSGFFEYVNKLPDEGDTITNFLRPGRTWKVRRDKIDEYNQAFRALQNLHFGPRQSCKGFEHKGTTACMEMFRALGFVPIKKAKAHLSHLFRGARATDPTKVQGGEGNPKCSRDVLYICVFEHNTENVHKNLHYLWKDALYQPKKCVNSHMRSVEVLLEAAQAVDSKGSSEGATETNSLGYSCQRAHFGPK